MLKVAKAVAKYLLPPSARRALRNSWENLRDWAGVFGLSLHFIVTRKPLPKLLLYFGYAPGDDLLCSAVIRELRKRGNDRVAMVSGHPELFAGNQDPVHVQRLWARYSGDSSAVAICQRFAWIWRGTFRRLEYAPMEGIDRRRSPSRHVIAEMCARVNIVGQVSIKPYLTLAEGEKATAAWAKGYVVIQSSGMAARHPAQNKQWYAERFQDVVDALRGEIEFIQLGSAADPMLNHVKDLRSATSTRESAAILHHARLYIGGEGFLMHVARAVDCPSVVVFGGRVAPWQIGYACNLNLYSAIPCAPCWRGNTCDFDRKCMNNIAVADVVSAVRQMLARPRGPLAVETVEIAPGL